MAEPDTHDKSMAEARIEISLSRLGQLFNSLDPSPFHERDLDHDAEEYIIGSAEETAWQPPLCLVIHLPADQLPETGRSDLGEAIHNYFAYRETNERRRLRLLFRNGRITLLTGLALLFCCIMLRELEFSLGSGAASDIIGQGMLLGSHVVPYWKFFSTVPMRRRCRILAKLLAMPVIVQPK